MQCVYNTVIYCNIVDEPSNSAVEDVITLICGMCSNRDPHMVQCLRLTLPRICKF